MIARYAGSVRSRLTLIATVGVAALCVLVNSLVLVGLHKAAVDYRTQEVTSAALRVVHLVKRGDLTSVIVTDVEGIQVINLDGEVVASTANLMGKDRLLTLMPDEDSASRTEVVCGLTVFDPPCQVVTVFRVYEIEGDWLVYAFGDTVPWYVHPWVLAFLIGISAALTVLTWFGTSRTVERTLAPVEAIRQKLDEITATDLGQRVPVPPNPDELHALARTANRTLDRLEAAVEQQRRFASDASHDLRSPITAMRAQVEEALLHPGDADWEEIARALLASLDRLQAIVTDLLTLARLDAGEPQTVETVDLAQLVTDELRGRAHGKEVKLDLRPDVVVDGDRLRLARLLTNLLDNAERHAETALTVSVYNEGSDAVLEVLDDGAGIPPDQREFVFRRFTRLDASRNRDAGGTGLGLAIAREIAQTHGGSLGLADSDTGARFVLRLPAKAG
ncbi:HAMP domain-containing sensor histidine kinase [Nonomuraea sp. NPDC003804]|uniref:sensor histidine kinase n=1 Tax=Nonomuraea sp. NPDC003804 TaxID=3154547 RepID=UPI0033A7D9F0